MVDEWTHERYIAARRNVNGDPAKDYTGFDWLSAPEWQRRQWIEGLESMGPAEDLSYEEYLRARRATGASTRQDLSRFGWEESTYHWKGASIRTLWANAKRKGWVDARDVPESEVAPW